MVRKTIALACTIYLVIGAIEALVLFAFYAFAILTARGDVEISYALLKGYLVRVFTPDLFKIILTPIATAIISRDDN